MPNLLRLSMVALLVLSVSACALVPRNVDISAVEGRIVYPRDAFAAVHHVAFGPFEDRRPSQTQLGVARNKLMMVTTSVGIEGDLRALLERVVRQNFAASGIGEGRSPTTVRGAVLEATTDAVGPDHVYVQVTASLTILDSTTNVPILHRTLTGRSVTPVTQVSNMAWEDAFVGALNQISGEVQQIAAVTASAIRFASQEALAGRKPSAPPPVVAAPPPSAPRSAVDVPPSLSPKPKPRTHALVVGIERYRNVPPADFASRDGETMERYLVQAMGVPAHQVARLDNERAAKTDLEKYVEQWLPRRVEPGDTVFIYYSGHGAPHPKTGEAYLVPYDGDPAFLETTGYPLSRLYSRLAALPAEAVVVVLDACFSGAGGRSVLASGLRPVRVSVENPLLAGGKIVALTASAADQVSGTAKDQGHGLFTYVMLKGLHGEADQDGDGAIGLEELYHYVQPQVERSARRELFQEQTPQLLGNPDVARAVTLIERTGR